LFFCGFIEDPLQIRRLAAESGAIVDDFAVDLSSGEVNETQRYASAIGRIVASSNATFTGIPTARDSNSWSLTLSQVLAIASAFIP
jgi:hypothetical protein